MLVDECIYDLDSHVKKLKSCFSKTSFPEKVISEHVNRVFGLAKGIIQKK